MPNTSESSDRPTCIGYSEIDKYANEIYQKHFPNHTNYGDITKIIAKELPDFDLLVGGFP
jgi:DNA (cytosine-5)-methyltransferase 1